MDIVNHCDELVVIIRESVDSLCRVASFPGLPRGGGGGGGGGGESSLGPRPFPPMRLRKGGWGTEERTRP